jgi:hypothetical protein
VLMLDTRRLAALLGSLILFHCDSANPGTSAAAASAAAGSTGASGTGGAQPDGGTDPDGGTGPDGGYDAAGSPEPKKLPLAMSGAGSVLPDVAAVGTLQSNTPAGSTYVDPVTGVTVLRLTSGGTPESGSHDHGYSEGGPRISQSWVEGSDRYSTVIIQGGHMADIRHGDLQVSNWRQLPSDGEIGSAWSLDPATPRILYTVTDWSANTVERFDTATMQPANIGNWPWTVSTPGLYFSWFQNQLDDEWFVGMNSENYTLVAFRPSDGLERSLDAAQAGVAIDEPHIDRELNYVYVIPGEGGYQANRVWDLDTGMVTIPNEAVPEPVMDWSHSAPVRGGLVGGAYYQVQDTYSGAFYYRPDVNETTVFIPTPEGFHAQHNDWYNAGQWVLQPYGPGFTDQWFVADMFLNDFPGAKIRRGMSAMVQLTGEVRLLAVEASSGSDYANYPQPTLAPDGRLVMWTTDMNGSDRTDVFIARVPVRD